MQQWTTLIDKAEQICGGQKALAARLGVANTQVSDAKHGRRKFNDDRVAVLAEIVGVPASDVWLAQEDFRNPFRVVETAVIAILTAVFLLTLPSESQASARVYSASAAQAHIVSSTEQSIHCRSFGGLDRPHMHGCIGVSRPHG